MSDNIKLFIHTSDRWLFVEKSCLYLIFVLKRASKLTGFVLSTLIILSFLSCSNEKTEEEENMSKRTLLVYIGRDNDLSSSFEDKRDAIIEGWDGRGGNLVIYRDLPKGSSLEVVVRKKDVNETRKIYEEVSENSASSEVFSRVINEVVSEFPADSYGLIVFSHASGWLPDATLTSPRSLIKDNTDWMSLDDFSSVIPDNMFEFILFEACYMGGIEVAYELKDKTKYILASPAELLSPGFREVYRTSINKLFQPEANLISFASDVNIQLGLKGFESLTLTLVRTSGLNKLANWVMKYNKKGKFSTTEGVQFFDRNSKHLFFDFEQHYSRLTDNESTKAELSSLIDNCLVSKHSTPTFLLSFGGFKIEQYSGLTTYIPQEDFPYLNEEYNKTKWAQAISNTSF